MVTAGWTRCFSCRCDETDQKQPGKERVSSYSSQVTGHYWGKPGRKLEAGTKAETTEEYCLLAFFPCLVQPAFPGPLPGGGAVLWVLPHQENAAQTCQQSRLMEGTPQLRALSQMTGVCIKVTKTNQLPEWGNTSLQYMGGRIRRMTAPYSWLCTARSRPVRVCSETEMKKQGLERWL